MAIINKGNNLNVAVPQTGRTITESSDGTLEGSVTWKIQTGDINPLNVDNTLLLPKIATNDGNPGDNHPDDDRLECYNRTITFGPNQIITCVASYFGLTMPITDPTISFSGGVTPEPIETHPDFEEFGTAKNGAQFDSDGEFLGFTKFVPGSKNEKEQANFMGIDSYLVPSTNIILTWWENKKPKPRQLATVEKAFPHSANLRKPRGIKDFLLINESIRQVGNFYEFTHQYVGSGDLGWNEAIYDRLK